MRDVIFSADQWTDKYHRRSPWPVANCRAGARLMMRHRKHHQSDKQFGMQPSLDALITNKLQLRRVKLVIDKTFRSNPALDVQ